MSIKILIIIKQANAKSFYIEYVVVFIVFKQLIVTKTFSDMTKRRRLMGPKSVQDSFIKVRMLQILKSERCVIYKPFSLMRLALNAINYNNVPDFWSPTCQEGTIEVVQSCSYCLKKFPNIKLLAMHEAEHMSIQMGVRIDDTNLWDETREDADVRNKWLERWVVKQF